jgi:hypothetical protein
MYEDSALMRLPKPPTCVEENMFFRMAAASLRAGEGSTKVEPRMEGSLRAALTGVAEAAPPKAPPRLELLVDRFLVFLDAGGDISWAPIKVSFSFPAVPTKVLGSLFSISFSTVTSVGEASIVTVRYL